jgi:hypothetical protein
MVEKYLEKTRVRTVTRRHVGLFLRGPIPWSWLLVAMGLRGRALAVAVTIWQRIGMAGDQTAAVAINLSRLPFERTAAARGLAALEHAGLVTVVRHRGRRPVVTLQDAPEAHFAGKILD